MKPLRLLLVEDSDDDAQLILRCLRRHGYDCTVHQVMTPQALEQSLAEHSWDIILCDYIMPSFDALAALSIVSRHGADIPVIIVSGTVGEDVAVASLKHGAQDYILKHNLTRLGPAIDSELEAACSRRYSRLLEAIAASHSEVLEMILNGSALTPILEYIVLRLEKLSLHTAVCSILLTDDEGPQLHLGAAPSLPPDFTREITPMLIRPDAASGNGAAALDQPIIIADITQHPHAEGFRPALLQQGFHACWSLPIFSSGRDVVGTMAIFYRTPRVPSPDELCWVESAAKLVSVAIERCRSEIRIREQLNELLRWQNAMLNREDRVQQLKGEVNQLLLRMEEPVRYPSQA
jgi:CheY-like chemotaxis protein